MTRCDACGKYFAGVKNFDAHRTGTFSPPRRRCFTTEEMLKRGFASEKKAKGDEWYLVKRREALARQLERKNGISEEEDNV